MSSELRHAPPVRNQPGEGGELAMRYTVMDGSPGLFTSTSMMGTATYAAWASTRPNLKKPRRELIGTWNPDRQTGRAPTSEGRHTFLRTRSEQTISGSSSILNGLTENEDDGNAADIPQQPKVVDGGNMKTVGHGKQSTQNQQLQQTMPTTSEQARWSSLNKSTMRYAQAA